MFDAGGGQTTKFTSCQKATSSNYVSYTFSFAEGVQGHAKNLKMRPGIKHRGS